MVPFIRDETYINDIWMVVFRFTLYADYMYKVLHHISMWSINIIYIHCIDALYDITHPAFGISMKMKLLRDDRISVNPAALQ